MYNKKISVLIPAYNEEAKIADCLTVLIEIKKKSMYPIEIIVCDNGSTDKTAEIVKRFPNVTLVHEERRGTNFARQTAFESSTGDIIACIDADCIPDPDWIRKGASHFTDAAIISVSGLCKFSTDYRFAIVITLIQFLFYPILHRMSLIMRNGGMMLAGNVFVTKYALNRIGGFPVEKTFWGDDAMLSKNLQNIVGGTMIYDTSVRVTTSSRRYKNEGFWKTLWGYTKNWINVFFDKETDPESKSIR